MGYNTNYDMFVSGPDVELPCDWCGNTTTRDVDEVVREAILAQCKIDPFAEACKWYEHESDMKAVSEKYPDLEITLKGAGAEQGDVWEKEFRAGKVRERAAVCTMGDWSDWREPTQ